jgi:hypothetical protein
MRWMKLAFHSPAGFALVALTVWLVGTHAQAQMWPEDADWQPLHCGRVLAFDPRGDEPMVTAERDVVGDADAPSLYAAEDEDFVYFRIRVDGNPRMGNKFRPYGWAVELDTNFDRRNYELIGIVDPSGPDQGVRLATNTQERLNDPADVPEQTVATYGLDTHARVQDAVAPFASSFGNDPDYFVDWALLRTDLTNHGVDLARALRVVMGTSTQGLSIDADVACHDGRSGGPDWNHVASEPFHPDGSPVRDSDDDGLSDDEEHDLGSDPNDADTDGDGIPDGQEVQDGTDPNGGSGTPGGGGTGAKGPELRGGGGPAGGCAVGPFAPSSAPCAWLGFSVLSAWLLANRRKR